jgi:hypothetical protein
MSAFSKYEEQEIRKANFRTSTVSVRANTTAYALGDRVMLGTSDLSVYEVVIAGTTAGAPPSFNTALGSTTADGTVTWLTLKQGLPKRPIYVALHTADPTDLALATEVTGGSYARAQTDPADATWTGPAASPTVTANVADIVFPSPSAAWGSITHFSTWDRATLGNMIYYGALTTPKTVNNGDPAPRFPAGALSITHA